MPSASTTPKFLSRIALALTLTIGLAACSAPPPDEKTVAQLVGRQAFNEISPMMAVASFNMPREEVDKINAGLQKLKNGEGVSLKSCRKSAAGEKDTYICVTRIDALKELAGEEGNLDEEFKFFRDEDKTWRMARMDIDENGKESAAPVPKK